MKSGELLGPADPAVYANGNPCPVCGSPVTRWNDYEGWESEERCEDGCGWYSYFGYGNFEELIGIDLLAWDLSETEQERQARQVARANVLSRVRAEVCPCYTSS